MPAAPPARVRAVLVDLDGVVTRTASVHAQAWKRVFDDLLRRRAGGGDFTPFDAEADYRRWVDGKPRLDGTRSFLASRGITLEEGDPDDPADADTVCGVSRRKNELFQKVLREQGAEVFSDAVEQIRKWRAGGLRTAVVSSSRNCAEILKTAGLDDLFEVSVDGNEADRLGLRGKPAPDTFLEAARRVGADPAEAAVIEDAEAGVQAGRAGGFAVVVGVDREGDGATLRRLGADVVVRDLRKVALEQAAGQETARPATKGGRAATRELLERIRQRRAAFFLDYDGTLTPIVSRPELAQLSDGMRDVLRRLAERHPVAIVSGRDLDDVRKLVGADGLVYAGSHGFDIAGPGGLRRQHEEGVARLPDLDAAEAELREALAPVEGALVERKRFAIAAHYRNVASGDVRRVRRAADRVAARHPRLRRTGGKKIHELRPDLEWDKGRAVLWLLRALELEGPDVLPVYIGDDDTDEDAFRALADRGVGVLVGGRRRTAARYRLRDVAAVEGLLAEAVQVAPGSAR